MCYGQVCHHRGFCCRCAARDSQSGGWRNTHGVRNISTRNTVLPSHLTIYNTKKGTSVSHPLLSMLNLNFRPLSQAYYLVTFALPETRGEAFHEHQQTEVQQRGMLLIFLKRNLWRFFGFSLKNELVIVITSLTLDYCLSCRFHESNR